MPLESAAHRIATNRELVLMILTNFYTGSQYCTIGTHKNEREEQKAGDSPSDAHTLCCAALVCKVWQHVANKLRWSSISWAELEIYLNTFNPPSVRPLFLFNYQCLRPATDALIGNEVGSMDL